MAPLRSLLLLGFLAIQAFATPAPSNYGPNSCTVNEFWYDKKECCLPQGGPPKPSPPPPNKSCPPFNWYWHPTKSCCVPSFPPKPNPPPPQCSRGWEWNQGTQCCEPGQPTPTSTPSRPSQTPPPPPPPPYPGQPYQPPVYQPPVYQPPTNSPPSYGGGGYHIKRHSQPDICPRSLQACPMGHLAEQKFECVDTAVELHFCGGCPAYGSGQDCTAIEGAGNVGCEAGSCAVYTCKLGYKRGADGRSCVRSSY